MSATRPDLTVTRLVAPFLLLTLLTAGCAVDGPSSADRERARADRLYQTLTGMGLARTEPVRSVPNFRIRTWNDVDDRTLVVTAGTRERYLLELMAPCLGLSSSIGIGLPSGRRSLMASDAIVVRGLGRDPELCRIRTIWALEEIPGYDAAQPEG